MIIRPYDAERDLESLRRLWQEIGWTDESGTEGMERALEAGRTWVAQLDGAAESFALAVPGDLRYLRRDLSMSCITGVATSRVGKRQGLARRVTARAIAETAADGAEVATLGVFDQGFYDRLGFGTGAHDRRCRFDPASLKVDPPQRPPLRLTKDDWEAVHANRLRRRRVHGSCNLHAAKMTRADMHWCKNGFGLGFRDAPDGKLSHHVWLAVPDDVEYGPYNIWWMAWRTREQLLELLGVLKNLGDQVLVIRMGDPPGMQLQSLLDRPFRHEMTTKDAKHALGTLSWAAWQARICDLPACLEKTNLPGPQVRFNLTLTDPVTRFLDDDAAWRGVAGDYIVTLGPESGAERGTDAALRTMTASVAAFTRLWLGVGPATGLALTDDLAAPAELLEELDTVLRLPSPQPDWDF
ncbi:MAG: GNAT family N-acetyltransferase [Planctomycetota bacterium]|nr:GNAT family N-acetyltransferase [Planctomycetota bacterium]